jgi:hypothetical protein
MNTLTIGASSFTLSDGSTLTSGTISVAADGSSATFTPNGPLAPLTTYTVQATSGILDLEGMSLTPLTSIFYNREPVGLGRFSYLIAQRKSVTGNSIPCSTQNNSLFWTTAFNCVTGASDTRLRLTFLRGRCYISIFKRNSLYFSLLPGNSPRRTVRR